MKKAASGKLAINGGTCDDVRELYYVEWKISTSDWSRMLSEVIK